MLILELDYWENLGFSTIEDSNSVKRLVKLSRVKSKLSRVKSRLPRFIVILIFGGSVFLYYPATFENNNFAIVQPSVNVVRLTRSESLDGLKFLESGTTTKDTFGYFFEDHSLYSSLTVRCGDGNYNQTQTTKKETKKVLEQALAKSDRSTKAQMGRGFKKIVRSFKELSPETIRKSLVMLNEFSKPCPSIHGLNLDLKLHKSSDSLGLLERLERQSKLKLKSNRNLIRPNGPNEISRFPRKNDFEARLKAQQHFNSRVKKLELSRSIFNVNPLLLSVSSIDKQELSPIIAAKPVQTKTKSGLKQETKTGLKPEIKKIDSTSNVFVSALSVPQYKPGKVLAREKNLHPMTFQLRAEGDFNDEVTPRIAPSVSPNRQSQKSGLTKVRDLPAPVQDERLTPDGDLVESSQLKLTSKGRVFIENTKARRAAPLLQSRYEDKDKEFFPVYGIDQLTKKENHTLEVLEKRGKNITKYNELTKNRKLQIDLTIVEDLLAHPDTELHMNVMGQGREPISMVLNRGTGDYPLPNHIATFERRPEISKYNPYISNYLAYDKQIEDFDLSKSTSIPYEDLFGNSQTNKGPVFGETDSSTSAPTVNDDKSEL